MIELITAKLTGSAIGYATGGIAVVGVGWLLKRIPNEMIKAKFGGFMKKWGIVLTLGLSKWKWTKKIWNKTIEPYVIDAIDNIVVWGLHQFVEGMRSDNK